MDLLRAKMEADPETVAELAWKAMKEGRDVRAITAMLDRTYGDSTVRIEEPHTFDELAKLNRDERRQLIAQLEQEGRAKPFRADEWRAALAKQEGERRTELATLSRDERRALADDLVALDTT
jgi:hypothetical protein